MNNDPLYETLICAISTCLGLLLYWAILTTDNPEAEYSKMVYESAMKVYWDDGTFEDGAGI